MSYKNSKTFTILLFVLISTIESSFEKPPRGRIVGGAPVAIENVPYFAAFEMGGLNFCGATILSENFAITTRSCVYKFEDLPQPLMEQFFTLRYDHF